MSEQRGNAVMELLGEPEIVAWLEDYRPQPEEPDEEPDPPRAA